MDRFSQVDALKIPKHWHSPRHELPPPPFEQVVHVGADGVRLTRSNGHQAHVAFAAIDIILIEVPAPCDERQCIGIDLRSYTADACCVDTRCLGFAELEAWMLGLPRFDEAGYRQALGGGKKTRRIVWQRASRVNAALGAAPPSPNGLDRLGEGLWLEDRGQMLAWGSFEELQRQAGVQRSASYWENPDFEGERRFTIEQPTVLGGLRLERLTVDMPNWSRGTLPRPGMPVTAFDADVRLAADGLADLLSLKAHFESHWGPPHSDETRDDGSERTVTWQRGRQALVLCTFHAFRSAGWRQGCLLSVRHTPDLRAFYEDDYQRSLERHTQIEWRVLPIAMRLQADYASVHEARWLPRCFVDLLPDSEHFLVWRDDRAGRIGFANRDFALIYAAAEVDMLRVCLNLFRGHVRWADLEIHLRNEADADACVGWPHWRHLHGWPQFRSVGTAGLDSPPQAIRLHGEAAAAIAQLLQLPLRSSEMNETC